MTNVMSNIVFFPEANFVCFSRVNSPAFPEVSLWPNRESKNILGLAWLLLHRSEAQDKYNISVLEKKKKKLKNQFKTITNFIPLMVKKVLQISCPNICMLYFIES